MWSTTNFNGYSSSIYQALDTTATTSVNAPVVPNPDVSVLTPSGVPAAVLGPGNPQCERELLGLPLVLGPPESPMEDREGPDASDGEAEREKQERDRPAF